MLHLLHEGMEGNIKLFESHAHRMLSNTTPCRWRQHHTHHYMTHYSDAWCDLSHSSALFVINSRLCLLELTHWPSKCDVLCVCVRVCDREFQTKGKENWTKKENEQTSFVQTNTTTSNQRPTNSCHRKWKQQNLFARLSYCCLILITLIMFGAFVFVVKR